MTKSTANRRGPSGRRLLPLLAVIIATGALASPAWADDDDWHHDHGRREWREHERREHEWREHERWEHRDGYVAPPVVMAPPPAVYVPPPAVVMPAPGINIVLPIRIR